MTFSKTLIALAALALPLSLGCVSANAATAHNLQNGADTSNTNDAAMPMKSGMKMKMHHKKMMKHHKKMM